MIWELEYNEKEFQLQAREVKGLPPPDWAMNEPPLYPGDDFFLTAFYDLSTCRSFGESPGPIPWDKMVEYADRKELDPDVADAFISILRQMDSQYLKWYTTEMKKRIPKGKPHGGF